MNEKHGPNTFLIGILIGGAVGALLSSKRGRKILKDVAEYGLEYVGNSIDMKDIETILNDDEEEMSSYAEATEDKMAKEEKEPEQPSRRKRLFRGIKRK